LENKLEQFVFRVTHRYLEEIRCCGNLVCRHWEISANGRLYLAEGILAEIEEEGFGVLYVGKACFAEL
jgi:hypothetical protein